MMKILLRIGCVLTQMLYAIGKFFKKLWMHKQGRIGLIIIAFLAILAIFAPLIAPYDPYDVTQRAAKGLTPSWQHLLGSSITTGQDIFSMLIYGTRSSLSIGLITGIVIAILGSLFGIIAGYLGGWVDTIIMRVVDVLLVIPTLPLVIVMTNVLGTSYAVIVIVFAAFGWTGLARVIRSQVMLIKNANYVKAAELAGAMLFGHWWSILAPGVGIFLSVYSFMRIGLALEEILNPRMRKSSSMIKVFKHLNNTYLDEVFSSMDDASKMKGEYVDESADSMRQKQDDTQTMPLAEAAAEIAAGEKK